MVTVASAGVLTTPTPKCRIKSFVSVDGIATPKSTLVPETVTFPNWHTPLIDIINELAEFGVNATELFVNE